MRRIAIRMAALAAEGVLCAWSKEVLMNRNSLLNESLRPHERPAGRTVWAMTVRLFGAVFGAGEAGERTR